MYRSGMKSRSEVRKEKGNWSRSGERKEKSRSGMGEHEQSKEGKDTWSAGIE